MDQRENLTPPDNGTIVDPVKSLTFLERFYEAPLCDESQRNGESELTTKFYESMVGYVIDRMEPLSFHSRSDVTSPATKTAETAKAAETVVGEPNRVRMKTNSGNVFEGQVSNSIPHGTGRLILGDSGVTYQGRFRDGFPDGEGVAKWMDGSWYEGEFRRGMRHGRGMHVSAEDERRWYGGQWAAGNRHGPGETACPSGLPDGATDYAGDRVDGQPHGHGVARWPDGTRYDGHWVRGKRHGRGRVVWPGGDVYDGFWADGLMDGEGEYEWQSNPSDCDQMILCLCDKYTGQWSRSKKHGKGLFYSAETGMTVRGHWVDDVLDGPCEIVLSDGRRPHYSDLQFRQNVLYGTPPPPPVPKISTTMVSGRGRAKKIFPVSTAPRIRSLPAAKPEATTAFQSPCRQVQAIAGNEKRRSSGGPGPVRANVRSTAAAMTCDLTGHLRRIAAKRAASDELFKVRPVISSVFYSESELRAIESAFETHADRLAELYRAYGAFLANGPINYRPLMTRLGLWQMIIDSGLHARMSLSDFDDVLYENGDCAFGSVHDLFEPVYPWQFAHAVCELAVIVSDIEHDGCGSGTMATALNKLLVEHLSTDDVVQPKSYGTDDECWMNSRQTITRMYDIYRTMTAAATAANSNTQPLPPTALQLIRLYGPRAGCAAHGEPSSPSSSFATPPPLDSVLPYVLDAILATRDEQTAGPVVCAPTAAVLFQCSVRSVTTLLAEACPRIAYSGAAPGDRLWLINVETPLTFAEWYRFVLLCVRHCKNHPAPPQ